MIHKIDTIIKNIADNLYQTTIQIENNQNNKISLMSGMSGIALFYAYFHKFNNKNKQIYPQIIEKIIDTIGKNDLFSNYCEGLTGFAWLLEHLVQNEFIDGDDVEDILNDFDKIITKHLIKEIKSKNFDFFFGFIGAGNYFILRNKRKDSTKQLDSIVNALMEIAKKDKVGIKWESVFQPEFLNYNYGFAHGHVSIIAFFNKLVKAKYLKRNDIIQHLLKPAIDHLLSKEIFPDKKDMNRFLLSEDIFNLKHNEKTKQNNSTWGWCYGDLSLAWTLNNSAKLLNDTKLHDKVNEIMISSSERRDLKLNLIIDAHFCHGASSIFHIFNRYRQENKNKVFEGTVDFWLNQIFNMLTHKDGIAGYKHFNRSEGVWENNFFLLNGVAGVGLTLMSYLKPELVTWDECFLLS